MNIFRVLLACAVAVGAELIAAELLALLGIPFLGWWIELMLFAAFLTLSLHWQQARARRNI